MNENPLPDRPDPDLEPEPANQARRRDQQHRRRQYDLDRITFQYVQDYRAGRPVNLETYVQRYPHFARELCDFALYFHSLGDDLPEPDLVPAAELSAAARAALARIRAEIDEVPASDQPQGTSRITPPREASPNDDSVAVESLRPMASARDSGNESAPNEPLSSAVGQPKSAEGAESREEA